MNIAQVAPITSSLVGQGLDVVDRVAALSAQGVAALIVLVSLGVAYWQMRERTKAEERTNALLELRAKATEEEMKARLLEQKQDADKKAAEIAALTARGYELQRVSDEILSHTGTVTAAATTELEESRKERARFGVALDRLERLLAAKGA